MGQVIRQLIHGREILVMVTREVRFLLQVARKLLASYTVGPGIVWNKKVKIQIPAFTKTTAFV